MWITNCETEVTIDCNYLLQELDRGYPKPIGMVIVIHGSSKDAGDSSHRNPAKMNARRQIGAMQLDLLATGPDSPALEL